MSSGAARNRRTRARRRNGILWIGIEVPCALIERMINTGHISDADSLDQAKLAAAIVVVLMRALPE